MRDRDARQWDRSPVVRITGVPHVLFAVDDSDVEIAGASHTLLCGVSLRDAAAVVERLRSLRHELELPADFEFKWNRRVGSPETRDAMAQAFRLVAWDALTVVTIMEGRDRQRAAMLLAEQLADLIEGSIMPIVVFDEGIISDEAEFRRALVTSLREPLRLMQVSSARSLANDFVQCADVFAGFYNLKVRLALGSVKDRVIRFEPDGFEWTLSQLLEGSFSSALWGQDVVEIDPEWDYTNGQPPGQYREAEGLGLRIYSSVDPELLAVLYDTVGRPYTGCTA